MKLKLICLSPSCKQSVPLGGCTPYFVTTVFFNNNNFNLHKEHFGVLIFFFFFRSLPTVAWTNHGASTTTCFCCVFRTFNRSRSGKPNYLRAILSQRVDAFRDNSVRRSCDKWRRRKKKNRIRLMDRRLHANVTVIQNNPPEFFFCPNISLIKPIYEKDQKQNASWS